MKKAIKIVSLILAVAMCALMFAGCGGSDAKVWVVATDTVFKPFEYTDAQGKEHNVLVLKGEDGTMYRTEVAAFIDKYLKYKDAFGDLADEEKPKIVFSPRKSKAGNNYTDFDVQDIDG